MPESYMRSIDPPLAPDHSAVNNAEYDGRPGAASGPDTPGYFQMNAFPDAHAMQQDPLISFAGLGPNQLGWSGGQDFFDMLGPLIDVQYDQYR
jgi:hypothetical protein